jgi:hypothetical protein
MELDALTISFVVKIWFEETAEEADQVIWRGRVTHVSSSQRRYVQDLDDIAAFIEPYLEDRGVQFGVRPRVKRWLKQWDLRRTSNRDIPK